MLQCLRILEIQIMVTTYWGFYIPPDATIPLVERLVVDPVYLYTVMLLLVPLSFGFTYMMIKMAKEAERKAKLAKEKGPQKVAKINLSTKWLNWLIVALIGFQVFLNIAAYNAALSGMNNINLYLTGFILIVFAGMFHLYRYGMAKTKEAPPPPPKVTPRDRPKKELEEKSVVAGKLPDKTSSGEDKGKIEGTKEQPTVPKIQANTDDMNKDSALGTSDLKKP